MAAYNRIYRMWSLGLTAEEVERLRACSGKTHHLVVMPDNLLPTVQDIETDEPVLAWIGPEYWRKFRSPEAGQLLECVPQILLLEKDCPRKEFERALVAGFQEIVLTPLSTDRVHEILGRSLELSNVYQDMDRMAREIFLNRELLHRKSDILSFLFHFLLDLPVERSDDSRLRSAIRTYLNDILPLHALHCVFCKEQYDGSLRVDLHLDLAKDPLDVDAVRAWSKTLLDTLRGHVSTPEQRFRITTLCYGEQENSNLPDSERLMLLPVSTGEQVMGALAVLLEEPCRIGRDQTLALNAAMRHLAWILASSHEQESLPLASAQ